MPKTSIRPAYDKIPYKTFIQTYTDKSTIQNAGYGLFTKVYLKPFTWIGFYPGKITDKYNSKNEMYTMCTSDNKYILADPNIKYGVHMVNEAGKNNIANVWYVKLSNNYCLYFTGKSVQPGEELLTCYSQTYGKRPYPISNNCSDPRCTNKNHRIHSLILDEWKNKLIKNIPKYLEKINYNIL